MSAANKDKRKRGGAAVATSSEGKIKLRTAGDVISRLKWSLEEDPTQILMGYDDRINGPMEKTLADYTPIDQGGDIPQHRIRYFRRRASRGETGNNNNMNQLILWDRESRIDRLFGSGEGATAVVNPETIRLVWKAIANMERIAQEQEIRRQEKAKQRARKQQRQAAARRAAAVLHQSTNSTGSIGADGNSHTTTTRFQWVNVDWYEYDDSSSSTQNNDDNSEGDSAVAAAAAAGWKKGIPTTTNANAPPQKKQQSQQQLKMVTWNVLFDKYESAQTPLFDGDTPARRWTLLIQILGDTKADLIALQEATPQFVQLLCETPWIQQQYATSASRNDIGSVEPYGNLFLWKKSTLRPAVTATTNSNNNTKNYSALSVLVDGHTRKRSVVACLEPIHHPGNVLVCANVHLPCDAMSYNDDIIAPTGTAVEGVTQQQQQQQQRQSRAVARRRELNTIVAKLQTLESQLKATTKRVRVTPILLGDFNSDAKDGELENGGFIADGVGGCEPGMFGDAWSTLVNSQDGHGDHEGVTFHPIENQRAKVSTLGPRRIDRICIGTTHSDTDRYNAASNLRPIQGEVIGTPSNLLRHEEFSPSDHYGVSVSFELPSSSSTTTTTNRVKNQKEQPTQPLLTAQSAWARTVMPTTDTLLAVALAQNDGSSITTTPLFDPDSSLPVPHVTLLNGFAELMCQESIDLAKKAVTSAVAQTLEATAGNTTSGGCSVPFGKDSIAIFEHRASATLVCKPEGGHCPVWLQALYQTLRSSFQFCDEQESRFVEGWTPHVSLGKFGSATDARQQANQLLSSGAWFQERNDWPALAVVLYQRDPNDRKFYAIASVPLEKPPPKTAIQSSCDDFLADAGGSLSSYFQKQSAPFISNLERICQTTIDSMMGESSSMVNAKLTRYGSCQFNASLPTISDIDAVVELSPKTGIVNDRLFSNFSPSAYLQNVATTVKTIHPNAKVRVRIAGSNSNGTALHFLTIKLNPSTPSIDLMVCLRSSEGGVVAAVDNSSESAAAAGSIQDGHLIRQEVLQLLNQSKTGGGQPPLNLPSADFLFEAFEGALRLCKIWAYRRQIYGAQLGFLGGGGWALLIAKAMSKGLCDGDISLDTSDDDLGGNDTSSVAAMKVLSYFFQEMAGCWNQGVFALRGTTICDEIKEVTLGRGTVAVIAPASGGDFARNTTRSTSAVLHKEIQRANAILKKGCNGDDIVGDVVGDLFVPIRQNELAPTGSSVVFLEVSIGRLSSGRRSGGAGPFLPDVKAWAARQVLQILVALESDIGDADLMRPFSRPVRIKDKLLYIIRVNKEAGTLANVVKKREASLQEEASLSLGQGHGQNETFVHVCCLETIDFFRAYEN